MRESLKKKTTSGFFKIETLRSCFGLGNKAEREGIDAVADVFGRVVFSLKDVPQMPPTGVADDFGSLAVRIRDSFRGPGEFVIEARPAAVGLEFGL